MAVNSHLNHLESNGLLRLAQLQPELEYMFRHSLVHEAAYASLIKKDRKQLHLVVGKTLEELYRDHLEDLAPMLAAHFMEAGDLESSLFYYTLAGESASRIYANAEAAMHYTRALEIVRRSQSPERRATDLGQLYAKAGRALEHSNQYDEALRLYSEMEGTARLLKDEQLELAALIARTTIHAIPSPTFNPVLGQEFAERALRLAEKTGDLSARAKVLWNLLLVHFFNGRPKESAEYGEQALAIARQENLSEQQAYTLNDLAGFSYLAMGEYQRSLHLLDEAIPIWRHLGNMHMLADSLTESAFLFMMMGEYEKSIERGYESYELSRSTKNIWGLAYCSGVLGFVYFDLGESDLAISILDEALDYSEQSGFLAGKTITLTLQAVLYARLGDWQRGLRYAGEALNSAESGIGFWLPSALCALALVHLYRGNLAEAERAIQRAQSSGPSEYRYFYASIVPLAECEYYLAKKEYDQILGLADIFLDRCQRQEPHAFDPYAFYFRGCALLALGEVEEGRAALFEARDRARKSSLRDAWWRTLAALAEIEAGRGSPEAARQFSQEAREVIEYLADHAGTPELRTSFLQTPQVRTVLQRSGFIAT